MTRFDSLGILETNLHQKSQVSTITQFLFAILHRKLDLLIMKSNYNPSTYFIEFCRIFDSGIATYYRMIRYWVLSTILSKPNAIGRVFSFKTYMISLVYNKNCEEAANNAWLQNWLRKKYVYKTKVLMPRTIPGRCKTLLKLQVT